MYKVFTSLENLYKEINLDKNWQGAESGLRNRYPLRFVMFENFSDFNNFIQECSNHNIFVRGIEKWLPNDSCDVLITYSQLARQFEAYVKSLPTYDYVIAPFSEIARFYDNEKYSEFDSLIRTIRLIESPEESQKNHQRIYLPIIGMQNKMSKFVSDPNINIWEYKSEKENELYNLILTNGTTYGVQELENRYSVCRNMREWIALWQTGERVKRQIVCSSKALYNNARYALPDNAFQYCVCQNAYEFLANGLGYDFGNIVVKNNEMQYWETLASSVDAEGFDFEDFVSKHFNTGNLSDIHVFVQQWFEHDDDFSRWLIKTYILSKQKNDTYLSQVLQLCENLTTSELFSKLATHIFDENFDDNAIKQRQVLLKEAVKHNVVIPVLAERKVEAKLSAFATNPERGYTNAMKYMTCLTNAERLLMTKWLGEGKIHRESIKELFPSLYYYTDSFTTSFSNTDEWINTYTNEYVKSKISNWPTVTLQNILAEKNANELCFNNWHDHFKTVKTVLYNRQDIDVYYWIDGLGTDWIPFIKKIVESHSVDGVYLNEIYIATAELPTTTSINKIKLEEIAQQKLHKIGDLDNFAHSQKKYPQYIVDEIEIVRNSINQALSQYNGKKIAFISDHGISYMTQFGKGHNLVGITPNHGGRCGIWNEGNAPRDNNYIVLGDNKTICSLSHNSLSAKTPTGQGAHGGATPEEVLVPIIIVSGQKNQSNYAATILRDVITASNPVVRYAIKGLNSIDTPIVVYNGVDYSLHRISGGIYESEHLHIVETAKTITLIIGDFRQQDTVVIKTGAQEEDLFDF